MALGWVNGDISEPFFSTGCFGATVLFNLLPNEKIDVIDWSKSKAFAENKIS